MPGKGERRFPWLFGHGEENHDDLSLVDGLKVDIYLISDEAVEGELLAKAMNSSGQEIGRSKQTLALQKDDAKLISFTFDSKVDLDNGVNS